MELTQHKVFLGIKCQTGQSDLAVKEILEAI
jgi:hypothetical protein